MSENIIELLKEAREHCGMSWSGGSDPNDTAGRIDKFLKEVDNKLEIQHAVFQHGRVSKTELVFYHDKGISIFDVHVQDNYVILSPHDPKSVASFLDLLKERAW